MRLDITYRKQPTSKTGTAEAAFISSNDPRVWLAELSRWGRSAADWACYAVPESVQSVAVSGLFVVTEKPQLELISPHLLWFNRVGERLFVPIDAELTPSVSEAELAKILIFDVQLFHPTIGWVGFNRSDKLDLATLIDLNITNKTDWTYAQEGLQPPPKLNQISIQPLSNQKVVESLKGGLEQKPLKDIPLKDGSTPNDEKSALDKLMDDIQEQLLKGGRNVLDALNNLLPENTTGRESILDAPYRWLEERMSALQQKRESELQRLLDMFDDNPDEALKYAMPLDNPYANRGTAAPSSLLGERSTDFNLGGIGGGQAVDNWSTDSHYIDLRKKYLDAANRANENGDYRRAAYIYAHLLGDFGAAANVLEQGGFFREAAALYREHLDNVPSAARCLEKGGLYLEAIELYIQLEQDEKVGDLYQRIEQAKNAAFYYEKCVEKAINQYDYIETARLEAEKLNDITRAKASLLRGWHAQSFTQQESCLRRYFGLLMDESVEATAEQIEPIFKKSPEQRLAFLGVLINVNHLYSQPDFQKAARPIAYQIVSEETVKGNRAVIKDLEHFFPDDTLIGKDTSLFLNRKPTKYLTVMPKKKSAIDISCNAAWSKAFSFYDGFVAIGLASMNGEGFIGVMRSNWSGKKMEYREGLANIQNLWSFGISTAFKMGVTDAILIWALNKSIAEFSISFAANELISNNNLRIWSPSWMPEGVLAAGIPSTDNIIVLRQLFGKITLLHYNFNGELLESKECFIYNQYFSLDLSKQHPVSLMFYNSFYFFYWDESLFAVYSHGKVENLDIGYKINKLVQSSYNSNILLLATGAGLLLLDFETVRYSNEIRDTDFFAQGLDVQDIIFVSSTDFVVLHGEEALIFKRGENTATQQQFIRLKQRPVSLLRTDEINQFAVLYFHGQVEFYDL